VGLESAVRAMSGSEERGGFSARGLRVGPRGVMYQVVGSLAWLFFWLGEGYDD
jgi:hypothetical protein